MLDVVFEGSLGAFHEDPETVLGGAPVLLDFQRVVQFVDGELRFVENLLFQRVDLFQHCILAVGDLFEANDLLGGVQAFVENVFPQ